jgi:hypothetical protein
MVRITSANRELDGREGRVIETEWMGSFLWAKVAVEPTPLASELREQIRYFQWMYAPVIHTVKTEQLRAALPKDPVGTPLPIE